MLNVDLDPNRYNSLFFCMSQYEIQEYSSVLFPNFQHYRRLISLGGGVMSL